MLISIFFLLLTSDFLLPFQRQPRARASPLSAARLAAPELLAVHHSQLQLRGDGGFEGKGSTVGVWVRWGAVGGVGWGGWWCGVGRVGVGWGDVGGGGVG